MTDPVDVARALYAAAAGDRETIAQCVSPTVRWKGRERALHRTASVAA